jgi:DNA polymerase-1
LLELSFGGILLKILLVKPMQNNPKLFLFDGMNFVYRSYYAFQKITSKQDLPAGAIFGVAQEIIRLVGKYKPDYMAVCWESDKPGFRHAIFPEYKAARKERPADLTPQMPYIDRFFEAFKIPAIRVQSYEADDIIGTLATMANSRGVRVVIVTEDKDMLQLVNADTVVLKKSGFYNREKVHEKYGVPPEQLAHFLSLQGDASDNIPGAPGVGPKGARELVVQFGTVQIALENYWRIQKKTYRHSLRGNQELIRMCLDLVTIRTDVPVGVELEHLAARPANLGQLTSLFSELGFHGLAAQLRTLSLAN